MLCFFIWESTFSRHILICLSQWVAEEVELLPINQTLLLIKLATANFFFFLVCVHLSMCFWLCNNDPSVSNSDTFLTISLRNIYIFITPGKKKKQEKTFILTDWGCTKTLLLNFPSRIICYFFHHVLFWFVFPTCYCNRGKKLVNLQ